MQRENREYTGTTIVGPSNVRSSPRSEWLNRSSGNDRTGNRFRMLNDFVDQTLQKVSKSAAIVWFILYRDERNGRAQASQQHVATRAGYSVRTVYDALRELEERGLVEVLRKGRLNAGVSVYRVRAIFAGEGQT